MMRSAALRIGRRLVLPPVVPRRPVVVSSYYRFQSTTTTANNDNKYIDIKVADKIKQAAIEKEFTEALTHHKELLKQSSTSKEDFNASLERLRACYISMSFWEDALNLEYQRLNYIDTSNDSEMARHFYILGTIFASEGKLIEGTKQLRQSVALRTKVVGTDSFSHVLGQSMAQLAKIYFARQDLPEAWSFYNQAEMHYRHDGKKVHEIMKDPEEGEMPDMTGKHHPELTHILENQALVAKLMDNHKECALKFEEAIQTIVDHDDVDRKYLLQLGMAQAISARGSPEQAMQMYNEMLDNLYSEDALKANPMLECIVQGAIGESHYQTGNYKTAMTHLTHALTIGKEKGGETHFEVGNLLNIMGACQAHLGNPVEAEKHFKEALFIARIKANGDETHPDVQSVAGNIHMVEKSMSMPSWPGQNESR